MNKVWTILFLAFLLVPLAGLLLDIEESTFSEIEMRPPAPFPKLNNNPLEMVSGFEKWFNDRIFARFWLTENLSRISTALGVSAFPDRVLLGHDNWLFLGNKWSNTVDNFRGLYSVPDKELRRKLYFFGLLNKYLKSEKVPLIICFAPDKNAVYPEYLPPWVKPQIKPDILAKITRGLKKYDINVLDLTAELLKRKNQGFRVFYKQDSHWNKIGSFFAVKRIIHEAKKFFPILKPHSISTMDFENLEDVPEVQANWLFQPELVEPEVFPWDTSSFADNLVMRLSINNIDRTIDARAFFPGTNKPLIVTNPKVTNKLRLLFIHDSFGGIMSNYIHQYFKETIHLHYRNTAQFPVSELLKTYKPDLVIFEIVERDLILNLAVEWIGTDMR